MKYSKLILLALSVTCSAAANLPPALAAVKPDENTVLEKGITAFGEDLGGLTVSQAIDRINDYYTEKAGYKISVTFDEQAAETTVGAFGLSWDAETPVYEAAALGKSGNPIELYKARADLRASNVDLDVGYTWDSSLVKDFVEKEIAALDTAPANASLKREDRVFIVTDDVHGRVTNIESTAAKIDEALGRELTADMTIEADTKVSLAEVTGEMLSAVKDKLGTYHTDYSSSSGARKTNIRIASERIGGTLLMPGESFSVSDTILPRTAENGYELAPQYANGDSEMAYGGGVCQVSTTLYNAVIRAELQIDERHPHSMIIHYAPYSSDAAIAEGNKDFIFTNNKDYPVYIASDADGSELYFSIYGKEDRPENRTIEFESDTLSYEELSPEVIEDKSLAAGEEVTSGSSHPSVSSELYKVIYIDGEESERILMNKDHYKGTRKTIRKGVKQPETTAAAEEDAEEAGDEKAEDSKEKKKEKEAEAEKKKEKEKQNKKEKETEAEKKKKKKKSDDSEVVG